MEQNHLLSVIVPVYNVEEYLPRCVDSLLAQTYTNLELILVDDGAKDQSGAICDDYARKDSRIKVIHKPNGGLSSARNAGMDIAQGEYITFVDSDDWIESDAYEHLLGLMHRYQVKLVCGGNYDVEDSTGVKTLGVCPKAEEAITSEEMVRRMFLWQGCDSSVCDKIFHRELLEGFRFPEGKVCEDVAITYKIILSTDRAVLSEKPFYNYLHRSGSITMAAISENTFHFSQHTAEIYAYIREHHPGILNEATYLRVRSLVHNLLSLDIAGPSVRKAYCQQYSASRKSLAEHFSFIVKSPLFGKQERLTDILLILGIYRYLRPIYHRIKS